MAWSAPKTVAALMLATLLSTVKEYISSVSFLICDKLTSTNEMVTRNWSLWPSFLLFPASANRTSLRLETNDETIVSISAFSTGGSNTMDKEVREFGSKAVTSLPRWDSRGRGQRSRESGPQVSWQRDRLIPEENNTLLSNETWSLKSWEPLSNCIETLSDFLVRRPV